MSRKRKKKAAKVCDKPVDMNNVLRLQTTVCSNERFGPSFAKTVKNRGGLGRIATHITGVAKRLVPPPKQNRGMAGTTRAVGWKANKNLNKKLKKLAHKASRDHRPKRSAKLPIIFILLFTALGFGGYYGVKYSDNISLPNLDIAGTYNGVVNKIKDLTAGDTDKIIDKKAPIKAVAINKKASKKKSYKARKKSSKKRSYAKAKKSKKRIYKKSRSKKSRMTKAQKQRMWKKKLSRLKKASKQKKRRTR